MKYSEKVMDHFAHPRNVGVIEDADGVGQVGNPACGDIMSFYIKVDDEKLTDVKFQTFGCGAAIAVSSMISEMAVGKTLDEVLAIRNKDVAEALDGLPTNKMHCSNLGADALHAAIRNYRGEENPQSDHAHDEPHEDDSEGEPCACPYCDVTNPQSAPFCTACGASLKEKNEKQAANG